MTILMCLKYISHTQERVGQRMVADCGEEMNFYPNDLYLVTGS
jgi:hypothetical protein